MVFMDKIFSQITDKIIESIVYIQKDLLVKTTIVLLFKTCSTNNAVDGRSLKCAQSVNVAKRLNRN